MIRKVYFRQALLEFTEPLFDGMVKSQIYEWSRGL